MAASLSGKAFKLLPDTSEFHLRMPFGLLKFFYSYEFTRLSLGSTQIARPIVEQFAPGHWRQPLLLRGLRYPVGNRKANRRKLMKK